MKRVYTQQLEPGMIAGLDVYNMNDTLFFTKGTCLNDDMITMLANQGVPFIYVNEEMKSNILATALKNIPEDTYLERIKKREEYVALRQEFNEQVNEFSDVINEVVTKNIELDADKLVTSVLKVVNLQERSVSVFDMLHSMRRYDDATYVHCFNVSLICNVFAKWLNMSESDTRLAMLCGLLHDVGKMMIPEAIVKKPDKLTNEEYSMIKHHTEEGYRFLREKKADIHICNAALMHHERNDGRGYPLGLGGDSIDKFAKIVAIADVYDAMTSARVYRGPLCPFKVLEMYEFDGLMRYDPKYLLPFMENVANTYIKTSVELNDKRIGDIIMINKDRPSRPLILCDGKYIDLRKHPELSIESLK